MRASLSDIRTLSFEESSGIRSGDARLSRCSSDWDCGTESLEGVMMHKAMGLKASQTQREALRKGCVG